MIVYDDTPVTRTYVQHYKSTTMNKVTAETTVMLFMSEQLLANHMSSWYYLTLLLVN